MKRPKPGSQCDTVVRYIERNGGITPADAIRFGCYRLAARVHDLIHDYGYRIVNKHEGTNKHALYVLADDSEQISLFGEAA